MLGIATSIKYASLMVSPSITVSGLVMDSSISCYGPVIV
jgi:hypothetical protein